MIKILPKRILELLKPVLSLINTDEQKYEAVILRTLNAFAIDVMAIPSAEDLYWYVAQNVVGRLNFIDCVIYEANSAQTELVQVAALGEKNPFGRNIINPLRIPFGQGVTGRVAQRKEAIIIEDLRRDENYILDTQLARSEICVPMIFRNRVVGVIDSEHPDPNAFGTAELEILTTVAAMASAKLELLAEARRSNQRYEDLVQSHAQLSQEVTKRKSLEAKLFEARKLEAVGRLTGGFAHDFNNLLTIISGNLEFVQDEANIVDPDTKECLNAAQAASERGAKLIRNMLAFSQRSRLEPEVIDFNDLIHTTCELSKRILSANITLKLNLAENLWKVNIDKNATENALLNLIINARDAMLGGGLLCIATENIKLSWSDIQELSVDLAPGSYVHLSVQDYGDGIHEDHLHRIFDPFYTTKEVGMGTGLGLSMILGFMQQSGGAISVTSTLGQGSTFHLYFPMHSNSQLLIE